MGPVGIVVGNPKPRSRTLEVARAVADAAAGAVGLAGPAVEVEVDLAELAPAVFDWSSAEVRDAVEAVSKTSLLVVASPTYKASYTGLLKSFLDWFGTTGLDGVTVIPVMVGAAATHALAVEVHLRPVLVEIGASMPTRGLFVTEDEISRLQPVIDEWLSTAAPLLRGSVRSLAGSDDRSASMGHTQDP
jgi:FMN reductase